MIRRALLLTMLLLAGCAMSRQDEAPNLIRQAGWRWEVIPAGRFDVAVAVSPTGAGRGPLVVYLEGDGAAYVHARQPALDPTPRDPVALRLALADRRDGAVAWIARPCQYTLPDHGRNCRTTDWTTARYSEAILDSIGTVLDLLKQRHGTERLVLIGYSGGGAVAALLAARRSDVDRLVTVAANLDLDYWTRRDGLTPLAGSLDPVQMAERLGRLSQTHFTGGEDHVVGTDVVRSYLNHLPPGAPARLVEVPGFTHSCCWAQRWPDLQAVH